MDKRLIGCQRIQRHILTQTLALKALCDYAVVNRFDAELVDGNDSTPYDVLRRHKHLFVRIEGYTSGSISHALWYSIHRNLFYETIPGWSSVHLIAIIPFRPAIAQLVLYTLSPLVPGDYTFVRFADMETRSLCQYKRVFLGDLPFLLEESSYTPWGSADVDFARSQKD